jgi:SAM-dependent methyltransferase
MNNQFNIDSIVKHYEDCLEKHGDTHLGVDWPNEDEMYIRYKVMLEIFKIKDWPKSNKYSLLDFGCGTAQLFDFILKKKYDYFEYSGLDISEKFLEVSKKKYLNQTFYCTNILEYPDSIPSFDFIVLNGVFTEKRQLSFEEMWSYFTQMLKVMFIKSKLGFAFNVMSKAVDWEREDLFHVPTDLLIDFLTKNITRNFVIRNDYKLYEYTVYIYKT